MTKNVSFSRDVFEYVVIALANDIPLPAQYRDHILSGKYKNLRECHLSPDILLIYKKEEEFLVLTLIDIGSHSEMF